MMIDKINTIIVSDVPESILLLKQVFETSDYKVIFEGKNLQEQTGTWLIEPDLLIVIMDNIDQAAITQLKTINQHYPLPIVVFTNVGSDEDIEHAVESGVTSYIVNGFAESRVIPILTAARARFKQQTKLLKQIGELQTTLVERKVIDRAKGLVMQQRQCTEDEAYKLLRTTAMAQNARMAVLAQNIIDTASLLTK